MSTQQAVDLEIEEDLGFERRTWRFQRVGWIALALFLSASAIGLTGSGPLSNATTRSDGGELIVTYERFDRVQSPSTIDITFDPALVSEGELRLWIESDYLRRVRLEGVTPEPDSVSIDAGRYIFTFLVSAGVEQAPISMQIRPEQPGLLRTDLGIIDGPGTSLRQLVFP